jgi:hypothetical protein
MEIMLQVSHLHKGRKGKSKEEIRKPSLHLKENSRHQSKGMKKKFMVIVTHVMNMVTKLWSAYCMQGEIMKDFITP